MVGSLGQQNPPAAVETRMKWHENNWVSGAHTAIGSDHPEQRKSLSLFVQNALAVPREKLKALEERK